MIIENSILLSNVAVLTGIFPFIDKHNAATASMKVRRNVLLVGGKEMLLHSEEEIAKEDDEVDGEEEIGESEKEDEI